MLVSNPSFRVDLKNRDWVWSYCCSIMFNQGLYFQTLDLTKTKVLLNLGLEISVIQAIESESKGEI